MQEEKRSAKALPADVINAIVTKHLHRDPAQCIERGEGCAGSTNLRESLETLEGILIDLFDEHLAETPHLSAPRVDDSILVQIAQTNACENPVQFIRNHWLCANSDDIVAALKEVREAHETTYNELSRIAGLLTDVPPAAVSEISVSSAAEPIKVASEPAASPPGQPKGWQPYATAPRDGSVVDLFYRKADGSQGRITNVQFIPAARVNPKYAPGGEWEHLAQDGWRRSVYDDATLTDVGFTHWRLVEADVPADI
jgi:hypothetical protein